MTLVPSTSARLTGTLVVWGLIAAIALITEHAVIG